MAEQMNFRKDKWALRRRDGGIIVCDKVCLGVAPASLFKRRKLELIPGRDL